MSDGEKTIWEVSHLQAGVVCPEFVEPKLQGCVCDGTRVVRDAWTSGCCGSKTSQERDGFERPAGV